MDINPNHPIFNGDMQRKVARDNHELLKPLYKTTTTEEWNNAREVVKNSFKGNIGEFLMLFGIIDGVIHAEIFGIERKIYKNVKLEPLTKVS